MAFTNTGNTASTAKKFPYIIMTSIVSVWQIFHMNEFRTINRRQSERERRRERAKEKGGQGGKSHVSKASLAATATSFTIRLKILQRCRRLTDCVCLGAYNKIYCQVQTGGVAGSSRCAEARGQRGAATGSL